MAPSGWTDAELEHLRRHYADRGPSAIAADLDRTYAAVTVRAHLLGLSAASTGHGGRHPSRRLTDQSVAAAMAAHQGHGRISAAARDLGVSRTTLRDYLRRHPGVDPHAPATTPPKVHYGHIKNDRRSRPQYIAGG